MIIVSGTPKECYELVLEEAFSCCDVGGSGDCVNIVMRPVFSFGGVGLDLGELIEEA